jgi:hypothetical protein
MSPRAHDILLKAAEGKGLSFGGWLEEMALIRKQYSADSDEESDLQLLKRRFGIAVDEAIELANQLLEMVDEEPSVAGDKQARSAVQQLNKAQAKCSGS